MLQRRNPKSSQSEPKIARTGRGKDKPLRYLFSTANQYHWAKVTVRFVANTASRPSSSAIVHTMSWLAQRSRRHARRTSLVLLLPNLSVEQSFKGACRKIVVNWFRVFSWRSKIEDVRACGIARRTRDLPHQPHQNRDFSAHTSM